MQELVSDLPRKDDRLSVPFDGDTLEKLEAMAVKDERPVARQAVVLVRAAIELLEKQGYSMVDGNLRKVSTESETEGQNV